MRRIRGLGFLVSVVAVLAPVVAQALAQLTVTGYITDTMCGKRGANALHADHAKRAVASGKAKYALYDEKTRQLYILDSGQGAGGSAQAGVEQWLGQRVRVTGTLSASPIRSAGQSYAPDAVATYRDSTGNVRATSEAGGTPAIQSTAPRVQQHAKALDTSTPVAGTLSVASIEIAPR